MNKRVFLLLCVLLCVTLANSQNKTVALNSFNVPGPAAFSFSKIDNVPASLFTGQVKVEFPLFKKKLGDLDYSLDIIYTGGGGVLGEAPATTVGRAWVLSGGGMIIRQKRGVPDDYRNKVPYSWNNFVDPIYNGVLFNPGMTYRNNGEYRVHIDDPVYGCDMGRSDSQHDIFEFNMLGRTGKFYIGKDWQILSAPDLKLQIIPDTSRYIVMKDNSGADMEVATRIGAFTIIDESGFRYYFSDLEIQKDWGDATDLNVRYSYLSKAYVSSWMLSKIVSPFDTDSIVFNYSEQKYPVGRSNNTNYYGSRELTVLSNIPGISGTSIIPPEGNELFLNSINFSDNSYMTLDYFNTVMSESPLLRKINIYGPDRQLLKSTALSYQGFRYFRGYFMFNRMGSDSVFSGPNEGIYRKLCYLESVNDIFSGDKNQIQYVFDYYQDSTLNQEMSRYLGLDHWGYFNGKGVSDYLIPFNVGSYIAADRSPDIKYTCIGALKKIYYPSGGSEEFEYEANDLMRGNVKEITGGIRIKKRVLSDNNNPASIITKEYRYINPDSTSSGFLGDIPQYKYDVPTYYDDGSWPSNPRVKSTATTYSSDPVNNMSYVEGMPVGYRRVEEIFGTKGSNSGKIIREYTDLSYASLWAPKDQFPYRPVERPTWALGQLLREAYYNNKNELLKETINEYDIKQSIKESNQYRSMYIGKKAEVDVFSSNPSPLRFVYSIKNYYPIIGRAELKKTTEKIYTDNSKVVASSTENTYDALYYSLRKTVRHFPGKDIIEKFYYPFDFNLGVNAPLSKLLAKKIITPKVTTEVWSNLNNTNEFLLIDAKTVDYGEFGNGLILPSKTYELLKDAPVVKNTVPDNVTIMTQPLPYSYNATYTYTQYNIKGRIAEIRKPGGLVQSMLTDENDNVIAQVINAPLSETSFTSFESTYKGNWVFNGEAISDATVPSGRKIFSLANAGTAGIRRSNLSAAGVYNVAYWIKGASALVINGTIGTPELRQSYNGWNYYLHQVSGKTEIVIAGTGLIDALALYPCDAEMITRTYKPDIGITSTTDANARTQYFSYDDFGRLEVIKDKQGNITEAHRYQLVKPVYNATPFWKELGNKKCEPCPQNPVYTTKAQLSEMEDRNPASKTYLTRKWVVNGECLQDITAWTSTGQKRCVKDAYNSSYNNGQREQEEKDLNPCSPTFNTTRWVLTTPDGAVCPDNRPVYARLCVENRSTSGNTIYGDVVVRFYSDQNGNFPRPVSNVTVNVIVPGEGTKIFLCEGQINYLYRQTIVGDAPGNEKPFKLIQGTGYNLVINANCY